MRYYVLQDNITVIATPDQIPEAFEITLEEYNSILSGGPMPYYWDGSVWKTRPSFTHPDPVEITEGESYQLQLPTDYTELRINNSPTTETTISFDQPGTYDVKIEPFPYLPVTVTFIVNKDITKEIERTIKRLETDCHNYIISHYPETRQHTFKAKFMQIIDELTNNSSSYTQEQLDALTSAKSRLLAAMNWVDQVLDYFYTKLDEIKSSPDIPTLTNISWDFSQFDASDPGVTIEEIHNLLKGILWQTN